MKKLDLAIIGQGRSGKDIHGVYYRSELNKFYNVKYVVEKNAERRKISEKIYEGCKSLEDYTELFDKKIDLVVNASYSEMHYAITKDLLLHGKNVLVEKPFAKDRFECEDLIKTAKDNGVILAVFQNTTPAPYCLHAKKLMDEGIFGEIKQIKICFNNFARRWDWQTLQKKLGGNAYNTGPHPLGVALYFLDYDKDTKVEYSRLDKCITSGDAEDYAKIILSAPNKPLIDVEISSVDTYPDYFIKIQGTKGGMRNTPASYEYKYLDWKDFPERPVIEDFLRDKDCNPLYCSEELKFKEEKGTYPGTAFDLGTAAIYENVYHVLKGEAELFVKPEDISKLIGIIEKVHADNFMERKF